MLDRDWEHWFDRERRRLLAASDHAAALRARRLLPLSELPAPIRQLARPLVARHVTPQQSALWRLRREHGWTVDDLAKLFDADPALVQHHLTQVQRWRANDQRYHARRRKLGLAQEGR